MSKTKKESITTAAVKETPKPKLSPEVREEIFKAKKRIERFAGMMHGLEGFCYNVDEGREDVYEFSSAMFTIAQMIAEDAELTAKNLGELLEGGAE